MANHQETPTDFESHAEILVAHQLDLVAQLERQLRGVHRTMRQIEQLRSAQRRREGNAAVTTSAKTTALDHIRDELTEIDNELTTQHESCLEMKQTVEKMKAMLHAITTPATPTTEDSERQSPD